MGTFKIEKEKSTATIKNYFNIINKMKENKKLGVIGKQIHFGRFNQNPVNPSEKHSLVSRGKRISFFAQDTKLYWASIRGKRINGTGIDEEEVYLSDTPSSYYEKEYYEYQKEIRQLLTSNFPAIEDREKNNKLCSLTDDMHNQCLYYIEVKNREERYKKMKWWEN